ncbi:hypothetical protein BHM03_00019949 [Ensete ventricosum]|nr:hypothetical protein BHM03_00019949 [Ensete ventricosum]
MIGCGLNWAENLSRLQPTEGPVFTVAALIRQPSSPRAARFVRDKTHHITITLVGSRLCLAVRSGGVSLGGLEEEEGREEGEQKTQPLSRRLRSLESLLRPPRRELTLR